MTSHGAKVESGCGGKLLKSQDTARSCRIATIRGRQRAGVVNTRGPSVPRRPRLNCDAVGALAAAAKHLDVEIADLLAQRVAVDAEQIGGADLVAACRRQRRSQQWVLHLAQDAMIEPRWRQTVLEAGEVIREMPLDRRTQTLLAARLFAARRQSRLRELGVDHRGGDRLLRIERCQPPR